MSESAPTSGPASANASPEPVSKSKNKRNLLLMIVAVIVAVLLVSVVFLAVDWGGGDEEEPEMEIVASITPSGPIVAEAGSTVTLYVSSEWMNVDTDESTSLDSSDDVEYTWTRDPISLGAFDLSGNRYANFTAADFENDGTVTCNISYEDVYEEVSVSVSVNPPVLDSVSIDPVTRSVTLGEENDYEFTATAYDSVGGEMTDVSFSWTVFGLAEGEYELNSTSSPVVTFSALALPAGSVLLNVTGTAGGLSESDTSTITVSGEPAPERTLDYFWYDMFEVPFGTWYDKRADEIPWEGGPPYIYDWWGSEAGNVWTYTNMRLDVTGRNMPEINMNSAPQFLPRLGTSGGGVAVLDWYFTYGTEETLADYPTVLAWDDGWISIMEGTTTLDLNATKSVLGMPADEWDTFGTWWSTNSAVKVADYKAWMEYEGDERLDIFNMYEWPLQIMEFEMDAEKIGDTVVLDHLIISWGFEALMARWLCEAFMDDSEWYFEDFQINAEIGPETTDLDISTVTEYGAYAYETTEDGDPCWMWEALLGDYVESSFQHPESRYDVYADQVYENFAPGSPLYGTWMTYDYTPGALNLSEGETLSFTWPDGDQMFLRHVMPGEFSFEYGPMTVDYMEPMGVDFPGQVTIDSETRMITFVGPIDMWTWSRDQTRATNLAAEWDRLGLLPYGCPTLEFRLTGPPVVTSFGVEGITDPIVQGETSGVTVSALDQYGSVVTDYVGTVTFSSSDPLAVLPADYEFLVGDAGVHVFASDSVEFWTIGEQWVAVNDTANMDTNGVLVDITVTEMPRADSLLVEDVISPIMEGVSSGFNVTVLDQYGYLYPSYEGTITFESNDLDAILPADYEFTLADAGVREFPSDSVTFMTPGLQDLTALDTTDPTISGTQTGILVTEAPVPHFALSGVADPSYANETLSDLTVTVLDQWDNPFTTYVGTVEFTSSDPYAVLPGSYMFTALDAGVKDFPASVMLGMPGDQTVTATDDTDSSITGSMTVEVLPEAEATWFDVHGISNTCVLNVNESVTVDVYDQYDRVFAPYDGTVTFSANRTGANLPVDYTFDPGTDEGSHTWTDLLNFTEGEVWFTVTVTDASDPSLTGFQEDIYVSSVAPEASYIVVSGIESMPEGATSDVLVTVYDQFDQVFDNYLGTVEFSSDAVSGATLPDPYAFTALDAGEMLFPDGVSFDEPGTYAVTVEDSVDSGITGTQSGIVIEDLVPTTLMIEGAPATIVAGETFSLTVSVYDQYGDLEVEYEGTVQFESSDSDAGVVLPGDYTFTLGDAGTHDFPDAFVLMTEDDQTVSAKDSADSSLTDTETITVELPIVRTLTHTMYDLLGEPWGEWWPARIPLYGTEYVIESGEYNSVLYLPDDPQGMIMAPYRWSTVGEYLPELSTGAPEFMPVEGPTTVTGDPEAEIDIYFQYLYDEWWTSYWIPTWGSDAGFDEGLIDGQDGYILGTVYNVTMNRPAAEMWLGMPQGDNPATWWAANKVAYVTAWDDFIDLEANDRLDIWGGFEDRYWLLGTMMEMTENIDGDIELSIGHFSWGYEVLMSRWLDDAGLLNHQAYMEDFSLVTSLTADMAPTFLMDAVFQYSMFSVKANESAGDDAAWVWQASRIDYISPPAHPSEYEDYEDLTYASWNSGDTLFGQEVSYDCTPGILNLDEGETFIIQLPPSDATDVIGYRGVGLTELDYDDLMGGDASAFQAIEVTGAMSLGYWITNPDGGADLDSMYDPVGNVVTIQGPQTFDNVRHSPDGPLYHGAPWIEFNVTPPPKAAQLSEPAVAGPVSEASAEVSTSAELSAIVLVAAAVFLVIVALGCAARRVSRY